MTTMIAAGAAVRSNDKTQGDSYDVPSQQQ